MQRRVSALRGISTVAALVGGVIFLITGFVPEQSGYIVQQPMSAALLATPPERADVPAAVGPDAQAESTWRVYAAYSAELADSRALLEAETASSADKAPQSLLAFVRDPSGPVSQGASTETLSDSDAESPALLVDTLIASGPYSGAEAAFLFSAPGGEKIPALAPIDFSRLVCVAQPVWARIPKASPQIPQAAPAAVEAVPGKGAPSLVRRAGEYRELVEQHAKKYGLSPNLVLAIMHTESSFNPEAVSRANARGLMQVVPDTAGGEVHAYLNGTPGLPAESSLFNPAFNINYGTTYLHLLSTRHLGDVKDPYSRMLCTIAAYNGGPTAVYKAFGGERKQAIETINALTADEVREQLVAQLPRKETREYVVKVLASLEKFSALR